MKKNYLTLQKSCSKFLKISSIFLFLLGISLNGFGQNLTQSGFTGVLVPQFMASGTASRLPVIFRATVSGLTANTSYRYYAQGSSNSTVGGGTVDFGTTNSGAGNPLLINTAGTTFSYPTPSLSTTGGFETFTTDATGSYTGWFGFVNTGNARFTAGNTIFPTITLNAGGTGTAVSKRLALDLGITVLAFGGAGANNGSLLQSISTSATAKNLVAIYDNTAGSGRPLSVSVIESIGVTITSVPTAYSVSAGSWNTITPNTNSNGVRRIEQRSVTNNTIIGCAIDADGVWTTGSINTVNPTTGTTPTIINPTDAPLNSCVIPPVITSSLTATGIVGTPISSYTITGSNSPTTFSASNLPGGLTFSSPTISGTPTNAGTFNATISASNVAGSDTKTLVFTIDKGNQLITGLPSTDTKTYGDANYSLSATSNSGLTVSYSSTNTSVATVLGNTVTIVGTGTTTITASQSGDANYNVATSINQILTVTPKTLTITSPSVPNKVYDRTNSATITGSLLGLVPTDNVTLNGTGTFSQATVGSGLAVTSTSTLSGTDASKYSLTQPTGLTGEIVLKPLTVSGASVTSKVYDGNATATLTGATLNGILSTDVVTLTGGATFSSVNANNTIAINTSSLTLGGADAGNYFALPIVGLTGNIIAKPLTITGLAANNKVFDGTTTASLSGTAVLNGVVSGEESNVTLTGSPTATFVQSAAGNGIAVTVSGYSLSGSGSNNYSITQPTGLTADITAAPSPSITSALTASATYGVASTSYFITATNSPTSYIATGLPTGLSINKSTGEISGTPTDVAGLPFSVTISATNLGGTGTATLVYTVSPKVLTITSPTVPNKVYDRTNVATITGNLSGIVPGDNVTLNGTGTFSQVNVGSGLAVTSTSTLSGTDASKYSLTQPTGLTGEIVVKPLTVSGASVTSKVYDGNSTLTLVGATLNGILSPDVVTLAGGATFSSSNVGNNIAINTSSLILGGADAGNYFALPIVGLTGNITAKPLTITGLTANNKVFDGTTTASLFGTAVLNGAVLTDNVSLSGTANATFNNRNIGTVKPITITGYSLTGLQSGNYSVSQPTGLTANITPLALTVNSPVAQNKVFDGNNSATITGTLTGIIPSDLVTFIGTGTFASSAVGNGIAVTSTSTLGGAGAGNYTLTQPTGLTANITGIPTLTEVILPQFIQGINGTNSNRIPFAYRVTINNLLSNVTYRYRIGVVIGSDVATSDGAGNAIYPSAGTWVRSSGPSLSTAGNFGEFVTDATGSYTGWFITEPTGNGTRFIPGNDVFMRIILNDGAGGSAIVTRLTTTNSVKVINTVASSGANNGTGLRGNSGATAKNFVFVYDNETGTGRPLSGSFVESDGTANTIVNSYSSFYGTNVDGVAGAYGLIIPNTNSNGVRRIEQRDFATGATAGCVATDADGLWTSGANTVNPNGGTTAITISLTDAPLNTCVVTNTPPSIAINVTTTSNYVDGGIATSPSGSFATSGVLNDPTDPDKNFGIDFTIGDAETAVESLIVTATSSNTSVLPNSNLNLTGTGASRNLKITPNAEGFSDITVTVNDGTTTSSFTINYASSNASINTATTRFHTGTSDASTAQMIDNNLMIVGDDENQALRLYDRQNSGLPIKSFDFTTSLGLTDISGGLTREVDIEASAKVGNRIYWMGSHSNASSGNNRPNRSRFFATDISGTGNSTTLSYIGRYDNLKSDLLAWDATNGHGLGANFLGLTASTATGIAPEIGGGSGFNIEGFEIAPNNTTAYICFRAPLQITTTRTKALIIPFTNFADLVSGNPTSTTATFGTPIQLDLGGRAIREMKKNASGEYLIIAGPNDGSTGIAPKDFRFYTWTGNPTDAPILRSANLTALNSGGSFESIVDLPSPLLSTFNLQVLVDNGDAIFYGNGTIAKELPQNNHKKFRSETINLGTEILPLITIKSIATGNWESTSTWNLGRVPQAGDLVIIDQNHEVTLNGNGNAKKIEYQGTGKLIFSSIASILNTGL
jgi:YDG domain